MAHAVKFGRTPMSYWKNYVEWVEALGLGERKNEITTDGAVINDEGTEVTFQTFVFEAGTKNKILEERPHACFHCGCTPEGGDRHPAPVRVGLTIPLTADPKAYNLVVLPIRP